MATTFEEVEMGSVASNPVASGRVSAGRLLRVGVLAAVLSAGANALVLAIASSFLGAIVIPPEGVVTFGQVVGASVAGAVGAAAIFAVIGRFTRRPIRMFWGVATVGLILSFLPIALVGVTGWSAGTLALMHVVAAVTNVGLLTTLGRVA
jgi:Family of unknown function (DUF6069)